MLLMVRHFRISHRENLHEIIYFWHKIYYLIYHCSWEDKLLFRISRRELSTKKVFVYICVCETSVRTTNWYNGHWNTDLKSSSLAVLYDCLILTVNESSFYRNRHSGEHLTLAIYFTFPKTSENISFVYAAKIYFHCNMFNFLGILSIAPYFFHSQLAHPLHFWPLVWKYIMFGQNYLTLWGKMMPF